MLKTYLLKKFEVLSNNEFMVVMDFVFKQYGSYLQYSENRKHYKGCSYLRNFDGFDETYASVPVYAEIFKMFRDEQIRRITSC